MVNKKKYQNTILYLCQKLGGKIKGKKKLAKLLYFVDFDFYEKYEKSITGATYRHLPMGPYPVGLEEVTKEMSKKNLLTIDLVKEREEYISTETYGCVVESDTSLFSSNEIKMLDRVVDKYGHLNGKQLEELSHSEAPYIATKLKDEIPYELSFYRGTDFTEL